jgi:hypothetical protein
MEDGKCYVECVKSCIDDCQKNPAKYMPLQIGGCTRTCDEECFRDCFPSAALEEVETIDFDVDE